VETVVVKFAMFVVLVEILPVFVLTTVVKFDIAVAFVVIADELAETVVERLAMVEV